MAQQEGVSAHTLTDKEIKDRYRKAWQDVHLLTELVGERESAERMERYAEMTDEQIAAEQVQILADLRQARREEKVALDKTRALQSAYNDIRDELADRPVRRRHAVG